jgi:hypothetical protein
MQAFVKVCFGHVTDVTDSAPSAITGTSDCLSLSAQQHFMYARGRSPVVLHRKGLGSR